MKTLKSRQRGHGDYGLMIWLLKALPSALAVAVIAVLALIVWVVRR